MVIGFFYWGYWWLLMTIDTYSIGGYEYLFYWWLLMAISGYSINTY
jgi:hypothetical protein